MITEGMPVLAVVLGIATVGLIGGAVWMIRRSGLKATEQGAGSPSPTEGQTEGVDRSPTHGVSEIEDPDPHGWKDS